MKTQNNINPLNGMGMSAPGATCASVQPMDFGMMQQMMSVMPMLMQFFQMMQGQMPQMVQQWFQQVLQQQGVAPQPQVQEQSVLPAQSEKPEVKKAEASEEEKYPYGLKDRFYTMDEVSSLLKLSTVTLWRYHKEGKLVHGKGTPVRYSRETLVKYLDTFYNNADE